MSGLPRGWEKTPLDSICYKFRGVSYAKDESSITFRENFLPILRANNIDNDSLIFEDLIWVKNNKITENQLLKKGDIIVAMSSGSKKVVGKTGQVLEDWEGAFGAFCGVLRPSKNINSSYVGLFLRTKEYRDTISSLAAGSNINNLKNEHFAEIEVPVPPLIEQHRIVTKLQDLLAKVDTSQKRLAKIPVILKRFRQAVLAAACSGRLTADWREANGFGEGDALPEGWLRANVEMVSESLKYGTSQKCFPENKGVRVLRIPNIGEGIIDVSNLKFAELADKEFQQLRLIPGDILAIRSNGSVSLVGKCAMVRESEKDFAYAGYLIRIRPDQNKVLPKYLNLALSSYDVRVQIEVPARSTSGVNNINGDELRALTFNLPSLLEQIEIVSRVNSFFTLADQLEARYNKAKAYVDKLSQSILAKAFRGELVPQDPNDEPASVLLERIRAERAKAVPASGRSSTPRPARKAPVPKPAPARTSDPQTVTAAPIAVTGLIPDRILSVMQPERDYSRADITAASGVSDTDWTWAIRQLRDKGKVKQIGERRGARYRRA